MRRSAAASSPAHLRIAAAPFARAGVLLAIVLAVALALALVPSASLAQAIDENLWATNGQVYGMARIGNTLYLGGAFSQVGVAAGPVVRTDPATGLASGTSPRVGGVVNAMVSDGADGWYLGGSFVSVNGVARTNLARIAGDGSVYAWNPGANSTVSALLVSGGTVYVGGGFTTLGGVTRSYLGAVDAATGVTKSWNPAPNAFVSTLALMGSTLYVGGGFSTIDGQSRQYLGAVDVTTGAATAWSPALAGYPVFAIVPAGDRVFLTGDFTSVSGDAHVGVVAVDPVSALPLAWNPNLDGGARKLALVGGTLWISGAFANAGGASHKGVAAVDASTGAVRAWDPALGPVSSTLAFNAMAVIGSRLYLSGTFTTVGAAARAGMASIDTATAVPSNWAPTLGGNSTVAFLDDGTGGVLIAGTFRGVTDGVARANLAAIDLVTGQATAWNPGADGTVHALAALGSTVYAGGAFATAGGLARSALAAFDATTGVATAWNPGANANVKSLAASGTTVYVGGAFTAAGGATRNMLAAIHATTGIATAWNPAPSGGMTVNAISLLGSTVYVGGDFTTVGVTSRYALAAIDSASGAPTSWVSGVSGPVNSLVATATLVHAGGTFGYRPFNTVTGAVTSPGFVAPLVNGTVNAIAVSGRAVALGGTFTSITGYGAVTGLAMVDTATWGPHAWNPSPNVGPAVLVFSPGRLLAGGNFTSMNRITRVGFASISLPPSTLTPAGVTVLEGNTGSTPAVVRLDLNIASSDVVSVNWATADSTALTSHGDYTTASGTVTFPPGETSRTIMLGVLGDRTYEGATPERFTVRFTSAVNTTLASPSAVVTITDDDAAPTLSIADVAMAEGNTGTSSLTFTLALTNPTYLPVTVNYTTLDSTATVAGEDYVGATGLATIPAESPSGTIAITVKGDATLELDEAFKLVLSGATNTTLTRSVAVGTILTDEMGPTITSVTDVRPDQGGWLRLVLDRCLLDDAAQLTRPIMTYNVWRKLAGSAARALADEAPTRGVGATVALLSEAAAAELAEWPLIVRDGVAYLRASAAAVGPGQAFPPGTWEIVGSFAAMQADHYTYVAPAQSDSPSVTTYMVSAHAIVPSVWYVGSPGSGAATDEIAPGVTGAFAAAIGAGGVQLSWALSAANDFAAFRLYRGASADFTPAVANRVLETTSTAWTDAHPGGGTVYYKLAAVDRAGNEGAPAAANVTIVTGIGDALPAAFALTLAAPNPFAGTTALECALPRASRVRVVVLDAAGRVVRELAAGLRPAGRARVEWDGRGTDGRAVAPGVYLCRMEAEGFTATRRLVRVR